MCAQMGIDPTFELISIYRPFHHEIGIYSSNYCAFLILLFKTWVFDNFSLHIYKFHFLFSLMIRQLASKEVLNDVEAD